MHYLFTMSNTRNRSRTGTIANCHFPDTRLNLSKRETGTTRSNVDFFMKKFKKLGFIEDTGGLTVNNSLLSVVLHE